MGGQSTKSQTRQEFITDVATGLVIQITEKMLDEGLINMSGFSSVPEAAGHVAVVIESCFKDHSRKYDTDDNEVGGKKND